jgi:glycosyltransferase involved in cell wall biosynthesis
VTPAVSIVLPVREPADAWRALVALTRLGDDPPFEVVVVDDGIDAETRALVDSLRGDVVVVGPGEPFGFGPACDRGADTASGDVLVLLDPAGVPVDGWLDGLVNALEVTEAGAALPTTVDQRGARAPEAHWGAVAIRRADYRGIGGFAGSTRAGWAEKRALVAALVAMGVVVAKAIDPIMLLVS